MPNYLEKLRGVTVQQDGVQLEGTGKVSILNFKNQLLDYNPVTGVLGIGPENDTSRAEVNAATTAALAANTRTGNTLQANANGALAAIDGVTLTSNNRILVKDEATTANNGWYYVADPGSASTPWQLTRTADADASAEFVSGATSLVLAGNTNGGKRFALTVGGSFVLNTDAVTFSETLIGNSITWKDACRVVTDVALAANTRTGNVLTASANGAISAIDGVTLSLNDRVLVKNEGGVSPHANNGIYRVTDLGSAGTPWKLTRAADAQISAQILPSIMVPVSEGTVGANKLYHLTTVGPITLNTTALAFATQTVAAAGSTLQLLYNNTGAIDGTSGITVVGSETSLKFGSATDPGGGLLRIGIGSLAGAIAVMAGRNAADSGNANLIRWGAFADNQLTIGESTNVAITSMRAATTVESVISGNVELTISSSVVSIPTNSLSMGATPASAGTIRLPQVTTIQFRNNADSANLNALRLGSTTDDIWLGDTVAGCDLTLFAATTITLAPGGSAEVTITSTAVDFADNNLTNVGDFDHDGTNLGFYGTAPTTKQAPTGSRGGNAALASLLTALATIGLITDSTSA